MNFNPYNFKVGDEVILDKNYVNSSTVIIKCFTTTRLYAEVITAEIQEGEDEKSWTVLTNRLTPINQEDKI